MEFGVTPDCMGCKAMLMNQGGKAHTEDCRKRIMRLMALSSKPKYTDRLDHWTAKVQHYFDVCGDAFNTVTLTDFSERNKQTHAEPTSPAVPPSPDPQHTPRIGEDEIEGPAEATTRS